MRLAVEADGAFFHHARIPLKRWERAMSSHALVEEGEYFCHCTVWKSKSGSWEASVLFERRIDHANEFVPGLRHKIKATFNSEEEAMAEAIAYAKACVENTKTGL